MEAIEEVALANFTQNLEKVDHIKHALSLTDTLKIFLQIAWELKLMEDKHFIEISEKMDTVGKMLGGWLNHNLRQNFSAFAKKK